MLFSHLLTLKLCSTWNWCINEHFSFVVIDKSEGTLLSSWSNSVSSASRLMSPFCKQKREIFSLTSKRLTAVQEIINIL